MRYLLTSGKPGIVSGGCSSKVIEKDDAPRGNVAAALVHGQPPLALTLYTTASAELEEMVKLMR